MKKLTKSLFRRIILPHGLITLGFATLAILFYYPLLTGKKLLQSDIVQYQGMSRELNETREKSGEETYWINNAYGGMPTYQLGAKYPVDFLTPIHQIIRIFPRPAHILFLYLIATYVLLLILKLPWHTALFGSLAYGFSTYLLIILQVGHNTKAMALAYMPLVFSGVLLLFQNKRLWGFALTTLAMALQIRANHYQMTYYMLLLLALYVGVELYVAFKQKQLKHFSSRLALLLCAGLLAIGFNATPLLATAEYTKFSTRGASELKMNPDGSPKEQSTGLDYDYITEYSYGIFESLNLLAPRIQGGGSREDLGTDSDIYKFLTQQGVPENQAKQFTENVPTYWGKQPILEAPAYVGVTVFFFALIAMFFVRRKIKYWLVFGFIFSLMLSWGKNFPALTNLFIDYFPLYNKFRAVSSIQVILEFCLPVLASLGVHELLQSKKDSIPKLLKIGGGIVGVLALLLLLKGMFSFSGVSDSYYKEGYGDLLFSEIIAARKAVFTQDILRAILFIALILGIIIAFLYQKINKRYALMGVLALLLIDLIGVSNRYIDRDQFVSKRRLDQAFQMTPADQAILQDNTRFRVYEPRLGLTGARTAYFHHAIGGYHGAKPRRFEELFKYYDSHRISGILDMLNVKYLLYEQEGELKPMRNPNALGNAWFVDSLAVVDNADAALESMKTLNFKREAVAIKSDLMDDFALSYKRDTTAVVTLKSSKPDKVKYTSKSTEDQLLVFSEVYYPNGWELTIDGKSTPILNVNYVLRAANIPKGAHKIAMTFNPPLIKTGSTVRWATFVVFIIVMGGLRYRNSLLINKKH